jgi:hypothetical protein
VVKRVCVRAAAAALAVAGVWMAGVEANAATFDLPSGFVVVPDQGPATSADWRPMLTVRPEDNPFSDLTSLSLREVTGPVKDPDEWLKRRLTIDVPTDSEVNAVLESPDSPFADPAFDVLRQAIPQLFESLRGLGKIGAELCDKPQTAYNAAGSLREMYCTFQIGPLRQYMLLRLQQVGGTWYYTEIKTANDRRLRELVGIADTFKR